MSLRTAVIGVAVVVSACSGTGASAPPTGGASQLSSLGAAPLPCAVAEVLQRTCGQCHTNPPQNNAPMPLVTYADVAAQAVEHKDKQVWQRIGERINGLTNESPMPQPYGQNPPPFTDQDKAVINNWLNSIVAWEDGQGPQPEVGCGAPGAGGSTSVGGGTSVGGVGNTGNTGGVGNTGNTGGVGNTGNTGGVGAGGTVGGGGTAGTGGTTNPPVDPNDCDFYDLTARADGSDAPFPVPTGTSELYQCFSYHVDLKGAAQAISFSPLIQSVKDGTTPSPTIHHWLLYAGSQGTPGTSAACLGFHPTGTLLAGWAPGAQVWTMPADVGMEVGNGDFILEVHYNNYTGQNQTDQSGARMCMAKTPRPNTAGISWLGNDAFGGFGLPGIPPMTKDAPIIGMCAPSLSAPVNIIKSWPHMHKMGRRMTAEIKRAAGGTIETLFDKPFDFNSQWQYDTPTVINPGDSIKTTCHFENDTATSVGFGEATTSEMCFNFTLAYPAHTLIGGGLHNNSCIVSPTW